jgi:hypothetical protein
LATKPPDQRKKRETGDCQEGEMIWLLLKRFVVSLAILILPVTTGAFAAMLSYDNILGSWCGMSINPYLTNLVFARDTLTVIHLPKNDRTVLKVDHYQFTDTAITLYYKYAGGDQTGTPGNVTGHAVYSEFGADDKTMVQAPSNNALYHFTRCQL